MRRVGAVARVITLNMEKIIEIRDLKYSYDKEGGKPNAVDGISLDIEKGSFVCVLGHNGSGKSTLAKLIAQVLTPDSGRIVICGKDTSDLNDEESYDIRRRVGMVFQNPDNQIVATVVEEDVAFGPENLGIPPEEIRKRVDAALERVGMEGYKKHSPSMLSGGQKQRVAIAGILAMDPEIVIFDEATAMLDPVGRAEVLGVIHDMRRRGVTVLHITHYMDEATGCDRVIVLSHGKVVMDGTPREVFPKADEIRAAGLNVPQTAELAERLRAAGYDIPGSVITYVDMADALEKYLK